jgi:predicted enzyme involved in methoxymalonyl-ACP biosynthesis
MAGETVRVVDFLLSCRVFGRRVEEAMLHVAVAWARLQRAEAVCAEYVPTARNKPCLEFFRRSGFTEEEAHLFVWRTEAPYPAPPAVAFTLPEWLAQA